MILSVLFIISLLLVSTTRLETGIYQVAFAAGFVLFMMSYMAYILTTGKVILSRTQRILILFLIYIFFNSFVAILNNIEIADWLLQSRKFWILLLIFPFSVYIRQTYQFRVAINAYILTGFIIVMYVLLWWKVDKSGASTAGISSSMSIWSFVMIIPMALALFEKRGDALNKIFISFLLIFFLLYIFSEGRRLPVLLVVTGFLVALYLVNTVKTNIIESASRSKSRIKILTVSLFVAIAFGAINENRFSLEKISHSVLARVAIGYSFYNVFEESPVVGSGYGYKKKEKVFYKGVWADDSVNPHSLYVDLLAHSGIVGLTLFLWFYFSVLRDAYFAVLISKTSSDIWLFSGFIGVLISLLIFFAFSSRGARPEVFSLIALIASISNNQILNYTLNKVKDK